MDRNKIISDIKNTLGTVPGFINSIPDDALESEWTLFKRFELSETSLPPKYKELVGLAVASVLHCWYCANFHKALAEFHGATKDEIQEAVHYAKFTSGWSTYLNGTLYDKDKFMTELKNIGEYVSENVK
jgi:AhpD family alkylhydroperoxidase